MKNTTTSAVRAIGEINIEGNIVPHVWFQRILTDAGKPDSIAILLLSDILYWYRPTTIRDEQTGKVTETRKKFKEDKLQRSYDQFAEQFGYTKNQVKAAVKRLKKAGLITLEFRNITVNGLKLNNVMYIEPVPEKIKRITHLDPSPKNSTHPPKNLYTPPDKKSHTNTEITAETTERPLGNPLHRTQITKRIMLKLVRAKFQLTNR